MTPPDEASLTFQEVQERFTASAAALQDVRTKVQDLADFSARQEAATSALDEAAQGLTQFAAAASEAVAALVDAQAIVVEAFAAVQSAMDGSQLSELHDAVGELRDQIATAESKAATALSEMEARVTESLGASTAEIAETVRGLEGKLSSAEAMAKERDEAVARAADVQSQLDRLKAAAGGRAVRKAGLED